MKNLTIFGLGSFGRSMITEIQDFDVELVIFDRDEEVIREYRKITPHVFVADVGMRDEIERNLPEYVDTVVIDLGSDTETTLKVLLALKKAKPKKILVRTDDPELTEVYEKLGAHNVIIPSVEAARRLTPILVSQLVFNYIPISDTLVMAEMAIPAGFENKTLKELDLRNRYGLNVVAVKTEKLEYKLFDINRKMEGSDILLVVGNPEDFKQFINREQTPAARPLHAFLHMLFGQKDK